MKVTITSERLTDGVRLEGDVLRVSAAGGGIRLNELSQAEGRYLTFRAEALTEHSLGLELRAYAAGGALRMTVRFGLLPRLPANITLDLRWLDGHVLFPGHTPGELKVVCHGSRIERSEIATATLVTMASHHEVRLRLTDVAVSDRPAPPTPLPATPLIDELGQYLPKRWPGKTTDANEMVARLRAEAQGASAYPFGDWTEYGGCADRRLAEGTGFFGRVKRGGRWYLTDPTGCAFFSFGPDCVNLRSDARVDGIEPLLRWLPGADEPEARYLQTRATPWGEVERGSCTLFSFERANLYRAFGDDEARVWRDMIVRQLKRAGMNTIGNWSDPALFGRMPYVTSLPRFPSTAHRIFRDFPDVLSPEYERDARACAQALAERARDPMMIGYFLRNEPEWAFASELVLAREVLRDPADTACKRALREWLAAKYPDIAALNGAWGTNAASFEALGGEGLTSDVALADLRAFSARLVAAYTGVPARACRAVDPNHMILGMRWAWVEDPTLVTGWESFDVFSINCYAVDPTAALDRVADMGVDLPILIGEYHFGALDAGLTATGLEAVATQAERAAAYRQYVEHAAAHRSCVGCHYFQCYDQFALGRFDGENYNIGLFDVCLRPYDEMLRQSLLCAETLYAVRAGEQPPFSCAVTEIPMIAY